MKKNSTKCMKKYKNDFEFDCSNKRDILDCASLLPPN